ncbi:MAG: microcystinase, partial [Mucilaginibacter sp.]|nr:microcystinase [Mucilaginibacter sp.]
MAPRYLIALIKHETNTFSPIPTPLSAFGHGHGPYFGEAAMEAFRGS